MNKNNVYFYHDEMELPEVGGKAKSLSELWQFNIPKWLVITPTAFENCNNNIDDLDSWQIKDSIKEEILEAVKKIIDEDQQFAVRSSAIDEDGNDFSFAGQLDTFLDVSLENLFEKIIAVWKSAFSERILTYRKEHQLNKPQIPAVIIQKLIPATSAGVAFSINSITGQWSQSIISSVWGLGSALVDGSADADTWEVSRTNKIVTTDIAKKLIKNTLANGVETTVDNSSDIAIQPSLTQEKIIAVAELARNCTIAKGIPQDIEWAYFEDKLYLLQSRAITNIGLSADPDGFLAIWDNSNIAESYGGVTTPLTYSFAKNIYEEVYRQFCKLMGVPNKVILDNAETYRGLLGLIHGKMYYNLLNWYKLLACFPGFSVNKKFMEQMMGVQEELAEKLSATIPTRDSVQKIGDFFRFGFSLFGMLTNHLFINQQIRRFYKRLKEALQPTEIPLEIQRVDELFTTYRTLENKLLLKWDAPLVNDFFAMIFYGVLKNLCIKWCQDEDGTLQNDLVGGDGNVISAEPAKRVKSMARIIETDEELVALFKKGTHKEILIAINSRAGLKTEFEDYLSTFGDRCLDELKLESPTIRDNPIPLLRAIGHFANRPAERNENYAQTSRRKAEGKANELLNKHFFKKFIFNWVLKNARERVSSRENLRFERTRLFGRVRKIMTEIGKRFQANRKLNHYRDIFFLEKEEILSYISGTTSYPEIDRLVEIRKAYTDKIDLLEAPANRFQTTGAIYIGNNFSPMLIKSDSTDSPNQKKGIGCCPGIVRGPVRVVKDPTDVELEAGTILVAERTDPGWIMLFPAAAGLLVERGSLLSHSAIVARELALPAIVSIPDITNWLKDGDEVEFNGSTGEIKLIKTESTLDE